MKKPVWTPSSEDIEQANVTKFMGEVRSTWGADVEDYPGLYHWSIEAPEKFWQSMWDFGGVIAETRGDIVVEDGDKMPGAKWFPEARLNYAENLLRRRNDTPALIFWGEDQVRTSLTYAQLYDRVSQTAQALRDAGVGPGDCVAGYLPNMPETAVAMLATASLGAVWSSCSPDFGVQGVLDRFGQIEPKVMLSADGYYYNGKTHDVTPRLPEILAQLPTVSTFVMVPYLNERPSLDGLANAVEFNDFLAGHEPSEISFEQCSFNDPLFILFSSGTTGAPKCIVHGIGGTLITHLREHLLHNDLRPADRFFGFTTCGWMMWNWLMSSLACETTLLLYDGSPFYPSKSVLFDFAETHRLNVWSTSARFLDAVRKSDLRPRETHDLSSLRTMLVTGSPLVPEGYHYVYQHISPKLRLSSVSGGTDIIGCFVMGSQILPVYSGEIQCLALGMAVDVFDDGGQSIRAEKGELVCTAPFPSMPLRFLNDLDGKRYHSAYFEKYPNVWCHGDFAEITERGGMIIYGRSDTILNPSGVRIGTSEIYGQVELVDEVAESCVVGQQWDDDVRVVLFVRLQDGLELDEALVHKIKTQIRKNTTFRHVPSKIIQIADIPRTTNGKVVEMAVRNMVHNEPVKNTESLANPEALALFRNIPELQV